MEQASEHTFVTELDCSEGLKWAVEADELLCDIKALLSEYYPATFTADCNALNVSFNNGQKFVLTVKELKPVKKLK